VSITIYAAVLKGRQITWADDDAEMTLSNSNFFHLWDQLGLHYLGDYAGHIKVKHLRLTLQTTKETAYHGRLNQLCAKAEILKAPYIAFA
jgi:hypothetical protein